MASTYGLVRNFDSGDNWQVYSEQLEHYFSANWVPEGRQAAIFLTVISPPVYRVVRDLCHPEDPKVKTYAELSKLLGMHYSREASVFRKRCNFYEAAQTDDESVNEWLTRIMNLAIFCNFGSRQDNLLRDKFISGMADQRIVSRLCEEDDTVTLGHMVEIAVRTESMLDGRGPNEAPDFEHNNQPKRRRTDFRSSSVNILDIPEEILMRIILHLNPRERVPLGNSCHTFHRLVFEDEELLRDLNFSKDGHLTSVSDIKQYFQDEETSRHIRRVNIRNVRCMTPHMLNNFITNASNLVDLNMDGVEIRNIHQFGYFLNMLQHLQKLTFLWKLLDDYDDLEYAKVLKKPFSRLTYLSVTSVFDILKYFITLLPLCEELRELHLVSPDESTQKFSDLDEYDMWDEDEPKVLKNLEIFGCRVPWGIEIKERLLSILPEPEKWTDFQLNSSSLQKGFYLEKNVEVCDDLLECIKIQCSPDTTPSSYHNMGWAVVSEILLYEVLRVTHQNVPQEFHCLSTFKNGSQCLLKLEDAKRLLKDPRHQISYLCINHRIEIDCDAHLIASAFPNLTELVLGDVALYEDSAIGNINPERRLRKKGSAVLKEHGDSHSVNLDSSFKMLVENTPNLTHLTLGEKPCYGTDEDALHLISGWKNLKTLRLLNMPVEDGDFLTEIGKQCKYLQQLELDNTDNFYFTDCFNEALVQMLPHCANLKDFSIQSHKMSQISELFTTLANNKQLRSFRGKCTKCQDTIADLISSIEHLLRCCFNLTTFVCEIEHSGEADYRPLSVAVKRWQHQLSRPNLQIQIVCYSVKGVYVKIGTFYEDTPQSDPFPHVKRGLSFS